MKLPEKLDEIQLMAGIGVGTKINDIIDYLAEKENNMGCNCKRCQAYNKKLGISIKIK